MLCSWQRSWNEPRIITILLLSLGVEDRIPQIFHQLCNLHCFKSESDAASSAVSYCWEHFLYWSVREWETEESLKGYGIDVYSINALNCLSPLIFFPATSHTVMFAPFVFVLGDREASRCWKWDHDEGSRPGETAVTQRQGTVSHKGRQRSITYITFTLELDMQIAHIIIYLYIEVWHIIWISNKNDDDKCNQEYLISKDWLLIICCFCMVWLLDV